MPEPYDINDNGHATIGRLRSAARRGDERAQATLDQIEQQKHTERWQAAEQAREDRAAERANRARPSSVAGVIEARRKEREAKEAQRKSSHEPT